MANYIVRFLVFCTLLAVCLAAPAWVSIILIVLYSMIYAGAEVVIIGLALDVFFGYGSGMWYHYTIFCGLTAFFATVLRPYLSVYNRR